MGPSAYAPVEVEWYQAPPVMYNLKLKMKVRSNHESARHLPIERPELTASTVTTSMGSLNGLYRRVSLLPSIKISGTDYTRIKESHLATRLECCQIDGSSLLLAVLTPSFRRSSKSLIRYLSIDLDTVAMLPWVTRLRACVGAVPGCDMFPPVAEVICE